MPLLSVVLPTFNEAANIGPLLAALQRDLPPDTEYLVVDDDSHDGTAKAASQAAPQARIIVRRGERGLGTAVVRGLRESSGDFVAVMDADFQHPPEAVRQLLQRAIATQADLVIGSRYAPGGRQGGFGAARRAVSWGAGSLARLALPPVRKFRLTDPMSGLFLLRRDRIDPNLLRPSGYKILLEILGRVPLSRVEEVGYIFEARRGGASKLGAAVMLQYLVHVLAVGASHPDNRRAMAFGLVGLSGVAVNLGLLYVLHGVLGLHDLAAVPIAVEASILSNFLLNDRFTFRDRRQQHFLERILKFNAVSLVALVVNLGVYAFLNRALGLHYLAAEAIAIVAAFGANYLGNLHWTYGGEGRIRLRDQAPKVLRALPFVLLVGAASWAYVGDLDRIPEIYFDEHYYVSVGRQIDNGIWEDPCWENDAVLNHRPLNYEHPPLAKLLIAWSIMALDSDHAVFEGCRDPDNTSTVDPPCRVIEHGEVVATGTTHQECYNLYTARAKERGNPYAWRLPSAVLGVAAVTFAALAARRIFASDLAGILAGSFVLMDGLMYTSARLAILDIFSAGFTMAAIWAATYPTKRGVVATALFLGLGFSSKYVVLFAGPPVALISLWSHWRVGRLTRRRFDLHLASYALIPPLVWIATYIPWWIRWVRDEGVGWAVRHWARIQGAAFTWGTGGYQTHEYASPPQWWFTLNKPVFYYNFSWLVNGEVVKGRWIFTVGNPILWWSAALVVLAVLAFHLLDYAVNLRYRWQGPLRHFGATPRTQQALVLTSILCIMSYVPFFLLQRVQFLFYMTFLVPMLALPLAGLLAASWHRFGAIGRTCVALVVLLILAAFLFYLPVVAGLEITPVRKDFIMDTLPWMQG